MSAGDDGIKVRATCADGHETVTTAPKGRVTWRGECHTDGCTHRIVARKVLDDPAAPTAPPADPPKPTKKIRKVAAYRGSGPKPDDQQTAPTFDGQPPAGGGGGGDGGPPGVPPNGAGGGSGPSSGLIDDTPRPSALRRARERARARREQRRVASIGDDDKPWTIPGIYR